jgi:anti-sigma factor RsiW
MNCNELLAALNEYVDGTADPGLCEELRRHLTGCATCQVVVDNIRQTITLYRQGQPIELPAPCRDRLHAALRERWRQSHPATT